MNRIDRLRLALVGVSSNKFRSFLTLLGIIIGVGAVILMVSLGSGTRTVVSGQISNMMTKQIYLGTNYNLSYNIRGKLTPEDEFYLEKASPDITETTPFYRHFTSINYKGSGVDRVQIGGVRPNVHRLTNLELSQGRSFNDEDLFGRRPVALVGEAVLDQLTPNGEYDKFLGDRITIDGNELIIVGILEKSNSTVAFGNSTVFVPASTFRKFWRYRSQEVGFYLIEYDDKAAESDVIAQINYLLNKKYGKANGKSKFQMEGLQGRADVVQRVFTVLTYVLGGIAAISLLVGGIGVMNIMLVTVKERTREIGLRMAIGATGLDIQKQFLYEAIILSVGGGIIGIIAGGIVAFGSNLIISHFFDWWQSNLPFWVVLLSFGVTVFIGLVFGFYPAYKASRLDPIEALRYE